ncbi:MAG TPA: hypothetical protein VLH37_06155 [Bacteroidales bacterium]|nr:hypothetical protein [Bacteroidales bacterium]
MKKLILLLFPLLLFGAGCEDETKLSDFIVGTWKSQELRMGDSPLGVMTAVIRADNTYVVTFTPTLPTAFPFLTALPAAYTIDNDNNQITIDEPDWPGDNVIPTGRETFAVEWNEDNPVMIWHALTEGPPPTITFTRQ